MELERFADVGAYLDRVGAFLEAREAEHNLLLAIASTLMTAEPGRAGLDYLAAVRHEGVLVATAIQTPPFGLVLSEVDRVEALDLLAADLDVAALPSVLGPVEHAERLARDIATRGGAVAVHESSQRIFRLTRVRPPRPARGGLRAATADDRDLLIGWFADFEREALGVEAVDDIEEVVDDHLGRGWIHLWDDGGPVSFIALGGFTPHGALLEGGYTPPALRGRGYGGNSVAAISQSLLDEGRRFVFLFTDQANPTSNHVYSDLGYEPVRDVEVWGFEPT